MISFDDEKMRRQNACVLFNSLLMNDWIYSTHCHFVPIEFLTVRQKNPLWHKNDSFESNRCIWDEHWYMTHMPINMRWRLSILLICFNEIHTSYTSLFCNHQDDSGSCVKILNPIKKKVRPNVESLRIFTFKVDKISLKRQQILSPNRKMYPQKRKLFVGTCEESNAEYWRKYANSQSVSGILWNFSLSIQNGSKCKIALAIGVYKHYRLRFIPLVHSIKKRELISNFLWKIRHNSISLLRCLLSDFN